MITEWIYIVVNVLILGAMFFFKHSIIKRLESYSSEKGKNLATKEDIGKITEEVQSVKKSFDESLENHKSKLQRKFEESKSSIALCQKLDNELLNLLLDCLSEFDRYDKIDDDLDYCGRCSDKVLTPLCKFLSRYRYRYESIPIANTMLKLINEINDLNTTTDPSQFISEDDMEGVKLRKAEIIRMVNNLIPFFLSRF